MNIPDKAVEAATKAFRETHVMDDALMNALAAAAPHLMAQAWQEGRQARHDHMIGKQTTNPYASGAE